MSSASTRPAYFNYWGKAGGSGDSRYYHPLPCHALDVAAVGVALAAERPNWIRAFFGAAQMQSPGGESTLAFLLSLHDLGKFGGGFQNLRADIARGLRQAPTSLVNRPHHSTLGFLLWSEFAEPGGALAVPEAVLELPERAEKEEWAADHRLSKRILLPWISAVTGHHGKPPEQVAHSLGVLADHFGTRQPSGRWTDARDFIAEVRRLLRPASLVRSPGAPPLEEGALATSSWWLAGFVTLCDWLGSAEEWFPYEPECDDLIGYWDQARERAARAVREAGLGRPVAREFGGFASLFTGTKGLSKPNSMQLSASMVDLSEGPRLFVLEDLTGSGKTEAAIILVSRLLGAGRADGFYFALPTMATANAMYRRIDPLIGRLFRTDPAPSFVLAHSGPRLLGRASGILSDSRGRDASLAVQPDTATAHGRQWLGDNRKKALLADAGVGTIDQALVAALQAKHNGLRILGLHQHVLVVDEVHACDEYMNGILCELLRVHAANGGSAVLLSATLPLRTRRRMVESFRSGLGRMVTEVEGDAYPALVAAGRESTEVHPVSCGPAAGRDVGIRFLEATECAAELCLRKAEEGRAVAWVRNTVRDAIDAFEQLATRLGGDRVHLLHARFPLGDRLEAEQAVMDRFGRDGGPEGRRGHVVVSTQVLEQSLDLDFDEMISDLAPIDRLIQRSGRLHRHHRPSRGEPVLHVLAPPWEEHPCRGWPGPEFRGTLAVYRSPGVLWLTQRSLRLEGRLVLPRDARTLVESVFGEEAGPIPESLAMDRRELEHAGGVLRDRSMAEFNSIRLESGYVRTGFDWRDDDVVPTRLGEPTTTLRLVREGGGAVRPWSEVADVPPDVLWRLGEVQVRRSQARSGIPDEEQDLRLRLSRLGVEPPEHVFPIGMRFDGEKWRGRGWASRGSDRGSPISIQFTRGRGIEFRRDQES